MPRIEIDPALPNPEIIARAAELLRHGQLVAFPTETVYGLGANALDARAVERIYEAKGRPTYNPIIVHVLDASAARAVTRTWGSRADTLARAFWPGPLTLVLPKRDVIPGIVTAGLDSVAVRAPAHPVARALLAAAEIPVAAPSANRSMELSPTTGRHVEKSLGDAVGLILDAGPTSVGIESTVVDLTGDAPAILRPGTISTAEIERAVGSVSGHRGLEQYDGTNARPSPGMLDRHYAPRAKLVLASPSEIEPTLVRERASGSRVAVVLRQVVGASQDFTGMPVDPLAYAAQLYSVLHALDDAGYDVVIVERVPDAPEWQGVRDRLDRAAR
jgi:L-threonylcarbamoyladenylate synthase